MSRIVRPGRHEVLGSTQAQKTARGSSASSGISSSPLLYLIEKPDLWMLSLGLSQFRGQYHVDWNLTMAASVLFMIPVIVLFFPAQRVFVEGVTLTGVKG